MRQILWDRFPGGARKALVMSYDDGTEHDRRLVELFNAHGIRGTFNLNSGLLDRPGYLKSAEVAALFQGHEVAAHTVSHPCLSHLATEGVVAEILEDRRCLEGLVGYPVRGLAYPGGDYSDRVIGLLPSLGIEYARTTQCVESFLPPGDFLRWPMQCRHTQAPERVRKFLDLPPRWGLQLCLVMGHSYEFDRAGNWDLMEAVCRMAGKRSDVWYATHRQVVDYLRARERIRLSADGTLIENPSHQAVWFTDMGIGWDAAGSVGGGEIKRLQA